MLNPHICGSRRLSQPLGNKIFQLNLSRKSAFPQFRENLHKQKSRFELEIQTVEMSAKTTGVGESPIDDCSTLQKPQSCEGRIVQRCQEAKQRQLS